MKTRASIIVACTLFIVGPILAPGARAGSHTWDVWEVFSNADGTVQFIELREANGTPGEIGLAGHDIIVGPTNTVYTLLNNVAPPTTNKSYLIATAAFAALPGAPTPNETIPANFIKTAVDTSVRYDPWDTGTWPVGTLPTNGLSSLQRTGPGMPFVSGLNSPTNYAGVTGSVDASGGGALPGVPDGVLGPPLLVGTLLPDGSSLSLSWNNATCTSTNDHQILYGQKTGFPAVPGGIYTLLGGTCSIGTGTSFTWNPTPNAADGSGLVWFLVVTEDDAGTEGPWGKYNATTERRGPGANGSSNVCAATDKDLSSACGH